MRAATSLAAIVAASALLAAPALDRISAESLRANITWLAADQRAGRMTPSPGLEASAEYIARLFAQAGLEPGGDGGTYLQSAHFAQISPSTAGFHLTLETGGRKLNVPADAASLHALSAFDYQNASVLKLPRTGPLPSMVGKIVVGDQAWEAPAELRKLESRKPALIVLSIAEETPADSSTLVETDSFVPILRIHSRAAAELLNSGSETKLTLHAPAPVRHDVTLHNVAGILRGADPVLRDQFVILSAHYDHLGVKPPGLGNRIYHGANDNASGAASLVEIAKAVGGGAERPRRSVLFLAVFGEEEGLLGSAYYVRHPPVPLDHTIADINLEQLGRTDSSDGPELARFAFTGPSYSDLPRTMAAAAKTAGVTVYRKETADEYFDRSDNYSFAAAGIVAHTIVVAFEFPGYHEVNDEADKLDYRNLVKVDRAIAAGLESVADSPVPPKWSDTKAAQPYRAAAR